MILIHDKGKNMQPYIYYKKRRSNWMSHLQEDIIVGTGGGTTHWGHISYHFNIYSTYTQNATEKGEKTCDKTGLSPGHT